MLKLMCKIIGLPFDEEGATMVEYAIMLGLIAVVSMVIITSLGQTVSTTFSIVSTSIDATNG